jgi:predicted O-methyltransferase YrrM
MSSGLYGFMSALQMVNLLCLPIPSAFQRLYLYGVITSAFPAQYLNLSLWKDYLNSMIEASYISGRNQQRALLDISGRNLPQIEGRQAEMSRDAGLALVAHISRIPAQQADTEALRQVLRAVPSRKLAVIELGSGCGIVGIGLAQMLPKCQILLTDLQEAEEIITRNIGASTVPESSSVSFRVLDWESPIPRSVADRSFDLILVSDCTYNSDSIPALVNTLYDLVRKSPGAVVVVSTKIRHSSEQIFFELMSDCRLDIINHTSITLPTMQGSDAGEGNNIVHIYYFGAGRNGKP